jgi:hypothetical protein
MTTWRNVARLADPMPPGWKAHSMTAIGYSYITDKNWGAFVSRYTGKRDASPAR